MPHTSSWKLTKEENPDFKCRNCESNNISYRNWESSDGAHEDLEYICHGCVGS